MFLGEFITDRSAEFFTGNQGNEAGTFTADFGWARMGRGKGLQEEDRGNGEGPVVDGNLGGAYVFLMPLKPGKLYW